MWHLGTWFSGRFGSVRFTVGLDDLEGSFQPKGLYDFPQGKTLITVKQNKLMQADVKQNMKFPPSCQFLQ